MEQIDNPEFGFIPDIEDVGLLARKSQAGPEAQDCRIASRYRSAQGCICGHGVFAMSRPDIGGAISRAVGMYQNNQLDTEERAVSQRERADQNKLLTSIPTSGPERTQAQYNAALRMPSLRSIIEHQMGSDARSQDRADERQWRTEQADLNRIETGEQKAADRVAKEDLKQIPTVQIFHKDGSTNAAASANASNAAQQYAGAATQVGVDRDGNPVYRLTKTGKLYGFDEEGKPREHEGIIAPKPANAGNPTEAERSSAGYLGRMQESEKNLGDAKPLPYLQQRALERAPGLTNYTMDDKQQVTRQQQEDWVRAKLRKESGAVIGDEEMAREIRVYFPQAGDKPEVLRQKAQSRMQAQEQMKSSAGRAKPTAAEKVAPGPRW